MRTLLIAASVLLCLLPRPIAGVGGQREAEATRARLEAISRELLAGIADGDWAPWERHASDALLYTTECGRTMTKSELRALFRPVPIAERRTLTMEVVGFRSRGHAAVLVSDLREQENEEVERYRVTATYWRVGAVWKLVASQVGALEEFDLQSDSRGGRNR
jgi:hypothetical protein